VIKGFAANNHVLMCMALCLAALHFVTVSKAQLCNGSLGDPVVNITFDSASSGNTNYPPPSAYTYTSSSCPNDGYYTITSYTSGCFGNHWHTVSKDHTGSGNFMLVNASYDPGDFFVTTVTDLCPNTNYQFSAWLMNVFTTIGIMPNITFSIEAADGSSLGHYQTGEIHITAQPTWREYGLYFTTPANNAQVTLRITNNAPGGNGNDLALDDITFRPCGPNITAVIVGNTDTVDICEGNAGSYTFSGTVASGFNQPVLQWQVSTDLGNTWQDIPGANSLSYFRVASGTGAYWYRLTVTEQVSANILSCRVASNTVVINVHTNPIVNAGPDRILIAGTPVILQGYVTGVLPSYYWSPSSYLDNDTILTPSASPPADFRYTLYGTSDYGCRSKDEVQVKVVSGIYVPNAFTPNNDGKNDHWRIPFLDPSLDASVNVYNRYGQVVYHAEGKTVDWDGTYNQIPQPSGAYVYEIKFSSKYPDMKGTILLIR
jgi:gliding motility-associated-like protein